MIQVARNPPYRTQLLVTRLCILTGVRICNFGWHFISGGRCGTKVKVSGCSVRGPEIDRRLWKDDSFFSEAFMPQHGGGREKF